MSPDEEIEDECVILQVRIEEMSRYAKLLELSNAALREEVAKHKRVSKQRAGKLQAANARIHRLRERLLLHERETLL